MIVVIIAIVIAIIVVRVPGPDFRSIGGGVVPRHGISDVGCCRCRGRDSAVGMPRNHGDVDHNTVPVMDRSERARDISTGSRAGTR